MPQKSIIVYGPQGCGKARSGESIRLAYKLDRIVDDWDGKRFEDEGVLYLTHLRAIELDIHLRHRRAFTYEAAMVAVRSKQS